MSYKSNNINQLFDYFYNIVNKIIIDIHESNIISKDLFYCKYDFLNEYHDYPLTFCLGGGGYILYKNIFENEGLVYNNNLLTSDYDISFSFNNFINTNNLKNINEKIIYICKNNLKEFKFMNLKDNIFTVESSVIGSRIHCRINCDTKVNKPFHILELSFWLNGKVSDNFTINDFKYNKLLLYKNNNVYYYLLPLDLLVKTTLYAIVDFFEKRNFYKCNKYLDRIKYIKKINDLYLDNKTEILATILESYKNKIKRKYKIIYDYPYIMSKELVNIKNNGIIKCIYRNMRISNKKQLIKNINKYKKDCDNEKSYINSEITLVDTDDL